MKSCAPPGMHGVRVIHHIRHYQSYNEGFGSTPKLSLLSHSSDIFSPNNKLSHPFFITQVFQRWSSLKVREAFLWPEGRIVWICQICYENLCGGLNEYMTTSIKVPLSNTRCSLWLRTVCNLFHLLVITTKFINKWFDFTFTELFLNKCVKNTCFVMSSNSNN